MVKKAENKAKAQHSLSTSLKLLMVIQSTNICSRLFDHIFMQLQMCPHIHTSICMHSQEYSHIVHTQSSCYTAHPQMVTLKGPGWLLASGKDHLLLVLLSIVLGDHSLCPSAPS